MQHHFVDHNHTFYQDLFFPIIVSRATYYLLIFMFTRKTDLCFDSCLIFNSDSDDACYSDSKEPKYIFETFITNNRWSRPSPIYMTIHANERTRSSFQLLRARATGRKSELFYIYIYLYPMFFSSYTCLPAFHD